MTQGILFQRRAGVILHPTSLPNSKGHGRLGNQAYYWVDWLQQAGLRVWQCLPLTPVLDGSPYNSFSAFAGNIDLIDIPQMTSLGFPELTEGEQTLLDQFFWFKSQPQHKLQKGLSDFIHKSSWLEDFCLFATIHEHYNLPWQHWPLPLRKRDPEDLQNFKKTHLEEFQFHQFSQFIFSLQWQAIKEYANKADVMLFGDVPFFVSLDSADVWCHRELFKLKADASAAVVAGVPPDYFSSKGQRWGNPLYQWEYHINTQFDWWCQRINHALELYDAVRIDHFRGFAACWEIPDHEPTAINGHWVNSPGEALLQAVLKQRKDLPLVAEDLGIITEDVTLLRQHFQLPGMRILQFAFDSDNKNPYLPHNHTLDTVIYTGTHDNNTTLGWFKHLSPAVAKKLNDYLAWPSEPMPWPLIKLAMASPARWAMMPLQDLLMLDEAHRMNTPGTIDGNWQWQFQWDQFPEDLAAKVKALTDLYNR